MIWWLLCFLLWITPAYAEDELYEQAPYSPIVMWEYAPIEEALLSVNLPSGFFLYRGLGKECTQWFMTGVRVGEVTFTGREIEDPTIPPDFNGEVCYEATSFMTTNDPTAVVPAGEEPPRVLYESYRSVRVGFHRLAVPSWWGDTAKVDY